MDKRQALKRYKKLADIISDYHDADEYFIVNDDPDMAPVKIYLPSPPAWDLIDNFGLPAKEQIVPKFQYPHRLTVLETEIWEDIVAKGSKSSGFTPTKQRLQIEFWARLQEEQSHYRKEIEWIKKQWYHRLFGYWVFINGKPTYLDGWHYMFQYYWTIPDITSTGIQYRDRDRRWFLFQRYSATTKETFAEVDDYGNALGKDGEEPEVIDLAFRVCYGTMYPKHRRDGATHKYLNMEYEIVSRMLGVLGGIQSFDDDNAGEHFREKLVVAFDRMPIFFKPMWLGGDKPKTKLHFDSQIAQWPYALDSKITYATTAKRSFYDGKKQYFYLGEEEGKTVLEDIRGRWEVVKPTLGQGGNANIHGFSGHPSTVADMEEGGGANYYQLDLDSAFYNRSPLTGQTKSGLFRIFIPAYDGLEGFIGRYGESVMENPTPDQAEFIGRNYGAKEYLEKLRAQYLQEGTARSLMLYKQLIELFPMTHEECYRGASGNSGLDVEIIERRINEIRAMPEYDRPVRGNYCWDVPGFIEPLSAQEYLLFRLHEQYIEGAKVVWVPSPDGRFEVSKKPRHDQTNLRIMTPAGWGPDKEKLMDDYMASADPFKFLPKTAVKVRMDKSKISNGGGTVFWERNKNIDPEDKPISEWLSHRFVCDYEFRADTDDEFAEEMLMMCVYWGANMYPETNVEIIWKHFAKRGFGGYLKYDIMPNGMFRDRPGFTSLSKSQQELFNAVKRYVRYHCHRERHLPFLLQAKSIRGIDDLTNNDLFTARGGALLGAYSSGGLYLQEKTTIDLETFFRRR